MGHEGQSRKLTLYKHLTHGQRQEYAKFLEKFLNVITWSYEDLKAYDTEVIQHKIPLKEGIKQIRQKFIQINPVLLSVINKEVHKLLDAHIIVPLRYSEWVENLVPVRKNNGEIILCIDFRNLNRVSLKDNYPLPKMDHILQKVVGAKRISMMDGFSGYNQVAVYPDDKHKNGVY